MNRKEILKKRRNLYQEIELLNKMKSKRMTYQESIKINKKIEEDKKKYDFFNGLLKLEDMKNGLRKN